MTKFDKPVPKALDAITDLVLAFRPAPKSESGKKRKEESQAVPKYIVNYSHDNGRNAWGVASKTVAASSPEGAVQMIQAQYPGEQIKVTVIKEIK